VAAELYYLLSHVGMPQDVTMQRPYASIVGKEADHQPATRLYHNEGNIEDIMQMMSCHMPALLARMWITRRQPACTIMRVI
jgi:hypothetical protein